MGDKYRHFDARKNGKGNRHPILLKKNNYRCSPKKLHLLIELTIISFFIKKLYFTA